MFVSPIVGSTGLNTKNVLALEHGLPLVTTALGADGLHVGAQGRASDQGHFPIAVADEPESFAKVTFTWLEGAEPSRICRATNTSQPSRCSPPSPSTASKLPSPSTPNPPRRWWQCMRTAACGRPARSPRPATSRPTSAARRKCASWGIFCARL